MIEALRYFVASLTNPQARRLGVIDSGVALARRHKKLEKYWRSHLEASKAAQAEWVKSISTQLQKSSNKNSHADIAQRRLLVLGAGHLKDLNISSLKQVFSALTFVDVDPVSVTTWKKTMVANPDLQISWEIRDVSEVLIFWRDVLEKLPKHTPWHQMLQSIRKLELRIKAVSFSSSASSQPSGILSLNLLSQIVVGWQNILESLLISRFGARFVRDNEDEWLQAFLPSAQELVKQHLAALNSSGAEDLLLITDIEYANYKGRVNFSLKPESTLPLSFAATEESKWTISKEDKSLSYELTPALYGIDLEKKAVIDAAFCNYEVTAQNTWLWHIQPQGCEQVRNSAAHGLIHRVGAFALKRQQ